MSRRGDKIEGGEEEGEEFIVLMDLKQYEKAGVEVSRDLVVMKIEPTSPFTGRVALGDKVTSINYGPDPSLKEWRETIEKKGAIDLVMYRYGPGRIPNVEQIEGYHYERIVFQGEEKVPKLNIVLKEYKKKVFVYRVDNGSFGKDRLIDGDRIVLIQDKVIASKKEAIKQLAGLIKKKIDVFEGFDLVVERGMSEAAVAKVEREVKKAVVLDVDCMWRVVRTIGTKIKDARVAKRGSVKDKSEYNLQFFHPNLTEVDLHMLLYDMPEGSYFIQKSPTEKAFILVVKFNDDFHHLKLIKEKKQCYNFMNKSYENLQQLLDALTNDEFEFEGKMMKLYHPIMKKDVRRVRGYQHEAYKSKEAGEA